MSAPESHDFHDADARNPEAIGPESAPRLVGALRDLIGDPGAPPAAADERALAAARAAIGSSASRSGSFIRHAGGGLAIAAALTFAIWLGWPSGPGGGVRPAASVTLAGDVNGDGRVNILDPFQAARTAAAGTTADLVEVDVAALLALCVHLEELDQATPSPRREAEG